MQLITNHSLLITDISINPYLSDEEIEYISDNIR